MVKAAETPFRGSPSAHDPLYRQIVDATPALLWMTDADNRTTYLNNSRLAYTGRTLEEELGFGWWNAVHDDDRDRAYEAFQRASGAREPFVTDYRLRCHDGSYRWLRDTGVPRFADDGSFAGYVGSCIDITDHKQTEMALKESERFAHTTVDAPAAHIAIIEKQLADALAWQASIAIDNARLFSTERQARESAELATARVTLLQSITAALSEAVTPRQVGEVIVTRALDSLGGMLGRVSLLSPDGLWLDVAAAGGSGSTPQALVQSRSSVDADPPLNTAVRLGQPVWIESAEDLRRRFASESSASLPDAFGPASANLPLIANGRIIGGIGLIFAGERTFSDEDKAFMMSLAQQCAQAVQRAQLFADEQAARHEAERANALKLKFLAMISHELRTPLTSIKGFATTLLADDVQFGREDRLSFLRIINEESDNLAELVDQLMDLSRLQAGTLGIRPERQSLTTILDKAKTQLTTLTNDHRLIIDAPDTLPRVMADAQRIAQVLVNLVGNAAKYAPQHSEIVVRARALEDCVRVDVCDAGPGIPVEARTYVFEAFRQVDGDGDWPKKGAGLGLAICKGLVEAHGGEVWVDETPDARTIISFTLPATRVDERGSGVTPFGQ